MNTRKLRKVLLTLCSALLLVSLSVGMTIAYLTDTTEVVTNTFTVGNVEIKLDEAKVTEYGVKVDETTRVTANTYKMLPGHEYVKDPTVYIKEGSESSFIRMKVEITNFANVKLVLGDDFLPQYFAQNWDPNVWVSTETVDTTTVDGSAIYEFWYKEAVAGAADNGDTIEDYTPLAPLFTGFELPGDKVDETNIDKLNGTLIKVTADAIQADGFDGDMAEAWAAFDGQNNK